MVLIFDFWYVKDLGFFSDEGKYWKIDGFGFFCMYLILEKCRFSKRILG